MNSTVTSNNEKTDLYSFIYQNLASRDYTGIRDIDSMIGIIAKLLENQSRLLETLYEKRVISEQELKEILNRYDFEIDDEPES